MTDSVRFLMAFDWMIAFANGHNFIVVHWHQALLVVARDDAFSGAGSRRRARHLHRVLIDWQLHAGLAGTKVFTVPGCASSPSQAFNLLSASINVIVAVAF